MTGIVELGGDINAKNNRGMTPLFDLVRLNAWGVGDLSILEAGLATLKKLGAEMNAVDTNQQTAVGRYKQTLSPEALKVLESYGATAMPSAAAAPASQISRASVNPAEVTKIDPASRQRK